MIELEKLMDEHKDLDNQPWWTEYLGVDIYNWPRARLIKLYTSTSYATLEIIRELYDRIDELKDQIFSQKKLIKELEEKYDKERLAKKFYRDQETKLRKKLFKLNQQLENNQDKELN